MRTVTFEERIRAEIHNFSGLLGLYADDLRGNVIALNADEPFESASCIKVFILAELYRRIAEGSVAPDQLLSCGEEHFVVGSGILRCLDKGVTLRVKDFATLMIVVSDNIATNLLIDFLGIDAINATCRALGFPNTALHNRIDFTRFDKLGTTTPREYGEFFGKIARNELWSAEACENMRGMFKDQKYNTLLTKGLPQYFLDAENTGDEELFFVSSKSGSMDACRNDGGIVSTPYGNYVVAIFTKDFKDSLYYQDHESFRFGSRVSRLLFDQYLTLEGRFR